MDSTQQLDRISSKILDYRYALEELKNEKHRAYTESQVSKLLYKLEKSIDTYWNDAFPNYEPKDSDISEEKQQELSYLESEIAHELLNERL